LSAFTGRYLCDFADFLVRIEILAKDRFLVKNQNFVKKIELFNKKLEF